MKFVNKTYLAGSTLAILLAMCVPVFPGYADDISDLRKSIKSYLPGVSVGDIRETSLPGLYEITTGPSVVYVSKNGRFMLTGDMIDLVDRRNLTEETKAVSRVKVLSSLGDEKMLVYTPKKTLHTVSIVTDIDCPYCRRLHSEIDEYMKSGIKVRYIFMPLKGKKDYDTTVSVWCSEDRNLALDIAKGGGEVESKTCDNPIRAHKSMARALGVTGTPAIILEDGTLLPGYVPVKKLLATLEKNMTVSKK